MGRVSRGMPARRAFLWLVAAGAAALLLAVYMQRRHGPAEHPGRLMLNNSPYLGQQDSQEGDRLPARSSAALSSPQARVAVNAAAQKRQLLNRELGTFNSSSSSVFSSAAHPSRLFDNEAVAAAAAAAAAMSRDHVTSSTTTTTTTTTTTAASVLNHAAFRPHGSPRSSPSSPPPPSPPPHRLGPDAPREPRLNLSALPEAAAQAQVARRAQIAQLCARYGVGGAGSGAAAPVSPRQVSRLYVEDRYRLLYCEVPKVGCTNWKRLLMVLSGAARRAGEVAHDAAHYANGLRRLDSFGRAEMERRLATYTKVLFVREPLERLVSAFRDKLERPNPYYQPLFGRAILARYRANASREALRSGEGVTFREFLRYLLDPRRPLGMDIHWEAATRLCHPCAISYDFVGKFEELEGDANNLLRAVGVPDAVTFPGEGEARVAQVPAEAEEAAGSPETPPSGERAGTGDRADREEETGRGWTAGAADGTATEAAGEDGRAMGRRYLSALSRRERQRAYDFYYLDYIMFNYSKPFGDIY
ncbi:carbohydrate sulfotransferase 8-like isoform X1 [Petromyzon marinus]|uniref:carbohydrate sulfotransferase 8-like isoform X1 n=1 Tax=Petromyzon marinus TaxID=7757 RepID=UPI003F72F403